MKGLLYPTHKRYGQAYAFIGIPLAVLLGYFPTLSFEGDMGQWLGDLLIVLLYGWAAYRGSLFGAEFPDIDSPNSKPAQKHYVLKKVFKFAGVKHRGKFSHDFVSLLIMYGLIYGIVSQGLGGWMDTLLASGVGNAQLTPLVALLSTDGLLLSVLQMYILFALVGSYSHLFADAMTKQGVWAFWSIRVHFVPVFLTKLKVGGYQPFKGAFKTGSSWETVNYWVMTSVSIVAVVISIISIVQF